MSDTVVTIFVEGDTEVDFYKKMIQYFREKNGGQLTCRVEVINIKGVGNYQNKTCRIFEKSIKVKNPGCIYKVFLCYDSDAFEFSRKPPVDWPVVVENLKSLGAYEVNLIKAVTSIEDWFLYDQDGLRRYLKLPKRFKIAEYKGQKGLEQLFLKAKRTYIKGVKCVGLIDALDLDAILPRIEKEIGVLRDTVNQ